MHTVKSHDIYIQLPEHILMYSNLKVYLVIE